MNKNVKLDDFIYEIIRMSFLKAGEVILNPNNWEEMNEEEQEKAYKKAWRITNEIHGQMFRLMQTIEIFRELKEFKKGAE